MDTFLKFTVCIGFAAFFSFSHAQTKQVIGKPIREGSRISTAFKGDKLTVYRNDGYAIIDLEGNTVCEGIKAPKQGFSEYFSIDYGIFFAQDSDAIVLKDLSGKTLGNLRFNKFQPFVTENTLVEIKGSDPTSNAFAYINLSGQEIVRFDRKQYLTITSDNTSDFSASDSFIASSIFLSDRDFPPYSEDLTAVQDYRSKKFGFMDKQLKLVIMPTFSKVGRFSDGLAAVQDDNGNWGYIDKSGKQAIPFDYSIRPSNFSSGLAKVKSKDGLYGFINKKNEIIVQPKYQNATNFYKGRALVRETYNGPISLIDSTGQIIASFPKDLSYIDESHNEFGSIGGDNEEKPFYVSSTLKELVDYGKGVFKKGSYCGLMDISGDIVVDFKYALLSDYHDGKMFAHLSEFINGSTQHTYGVIDEEGQLLLQLVDSRF